jgi:hypothetical protein
MSRIESMATPAMPTSPDDARVVRVVAAVGGEIEGDRQALLPGREVAPIERVESSAVEKPAYWRTVHGCCTYIVGYGPRTKGAKPGMDATSSAV